MDETEDIFGKSQWRGRGDEWGVQAHRWAVQFTTLLIKNFVVLYRRPLQLLIFLLLPSAVSLVFLMEMHSTSDSGGPSTLYGTTPLSDLGPCSSYYPSCVQVVYGPSSPLVDKVMETFSTNNGLDLGSDVRGFPTVSTAQQFVASHLGKVQFTVFFNNESLWGSYINGQVPNSEFKNMSYVIFYNSSVNDDKRSSQYEVNFPLIVLQKELDDAYFRTAYKSEYTSYDVDYGVLWQVQYEGIPAAVNETVTACDWESRHAMETLGSTLPWVLVFAFLLAANVPFQMVAEERRKKLFSSLRRLGLADTAYWASWFVTFQLLLLAACALAICTALIVSTESSALRSINKSVYFLILWMSGTAFVSLAFFLAAFCSTSSVSTALAFTQFLVALCTIAACTSSLNYYTDIGTDSSVSNCQLVSSSYNRIYSDTLPGNSFVMFLVFFFPWFHAAQAITDVLSVVQYKDQSFNLDDLYGTNSKDLLYDSEQTETYTSEWVSHSLIMLMGNVLVYTFLAWMAGQLVTSEAGEGRSLVSVFLPGWLRRALLPGGYDAAPQVGDVRGEERERSRVDRSIRAYKVSKTYSGVQALKELSVTMARGEVFVLLYVGVRIFYLIASVSNTCTFLAEVITELAKVP